MGQKQVSSVQVAIAIVAVLFVVGGLGFFFLRSKDSGSSPYSGQYSELKGGPPPGRGGSSGGGRPMGPPRGMRGPGGMVGAGGGDMAR